MAGNAAVKTEGCRRGSGGEDMGGGWGGVLLLHSDLFLMDLTAHQQKE